MKQTITEYARRRGCSRTAVYKAIAAGKIVKAVTTDDKGGTLIDPEIADQEWSENHNPAYGRVTKTGGQSAPPPPDVPVAADAGAATLAAAKRAKAVFDAKMAELDYRKKEGSLVEKKAVYEALFTFGKEIRNSIMAIPDRVLDDMLAAPSRNDAYNMLHDELAKVLERLSNSPEISKE